MPRNLPLFREIRHADNFRKICSAVQILNARTLVDGAAIYARVVKRRVQIAEITRVEARRRDIVSGRLKPFSGRLVDNEGKVRSDKGALDDSAIAAMNWFVEGVAGTLPKQ